MALHVQYPAHPPVPVSGSRYARSRKAVIVFGPRGDVRGSRTGWSVEEEAVARRAPGETYPSHYLGPWIDLPVDADGDSARLAFKQLLLWLSLAPTIDADQVCVPQYRNEQLSDEVRERVHVAVGCQLQAAPAGAASAVTLVPATNPLSVSYLTDSRSPLSTVDRPRLFVTKPEDHLQWLMTAVPTVEELAASWSAGSVGHDGRTPRDFAAAQQVAAQLLSAGRSRPWVQQYLSVFGFQNSKSLVGVWPEKRLVEVAPVAR